MLHTIQKKRPQWPLQAGGCGYCTVVQQHSGKDSTEGLIVILCRDWALSRPGWLASLRTWQAERCLGWAVEEGGVHRKGAGMWLKSQEHEASVSLQSRSFWLSD